VIEYNQVMFQYLGLILTLISWLAGIYLVTKWRDRTLPTISRHAASSKHASLLFAIVLAGCGLIFYFWLVKWFTPHINPSQPFETLLALAIGCQVITALAPDTQGLSRTVHRWAAYTMAVLYLPLVALIVIASSISSLARFICVPIALYMLVSFVVVALMGRAKNKYLAFQASYIMAFQVAILVAAYL
jgi:hypothetical protein